MKHTTLNDLQRQVLLRPYELRNWHRLEDLVHQKRAEEDSNTTTGSTIQWGSLMARHGKLDQAFPSMKSLTYDGKNLTPLIGNLYHREESESAWVRWVGPEPRLVIRFPFTSGIKAWRFEVVIAKFYEDRDNRYLRFTVNGTDLPLIWAEGNLYWSEFSGQYVDLSADRDHSSGFSELAVSIPDSHRPTGEDQRMLAFAISRLSMHALDP